ncbi:MAG: STAS/SEC14 domain-containing protein [Lutibacter sp.]|nr:STAS/SEC14 domain-containing protein [Lutibacter sp.]
MSLLKSNYIILKDFNLLIECHSGSLDLKSYINFVKRTTLDPLFSKNMNYLIDLSNIVFTASIDDITKYNTFSDENFTSQIKRKVALVTNSPNQMVFTTLFKTGNTQKLKEIEIFSTKESALEWLNSSLDKNEIFSVYSSLKEYSLK